MVASIYSTMYFNPFLKNGLQFFVLFFVANNLIASAVSSSQPFPCFYIFGDSLVDSGNNNDLNTTAKVNYLPYGTDFPEGPTGRFTNGLTTADVLTQLLGFNTFIPPFAKARDAINGVNYASGSAGIRNETGSQLGYRLSLDQQLVNHEITLSGLTSLYGNISSTKQHLSKCLYYSVVGSNDYINNYYQPNFYATSRIYSPQQYATVLIQQYSQQLKKLYNLGARKIAVAALGPLGCIPAMRPNNFPCNETINDTVVFFNNRLKLLVNELNHDLIQAQFIYVSAMDVRPTELFSTAITLVGDPCCRVDGNTGQCIMGSKPCLIRDLYFFFDNFHPSEIVNKVVATASYIDILRLI